MPWIFFLNTVDEMLEVIAVPLIPHALHDVDPAARFPFPVFGKLVITPFSLTEEMSADESEIFIINVDLPGRDFIFYRFEGKLSRHGISARFI